jgi:hypothetical protein
MKLAVSLSGGRSGPTHSDEEIVRRMLAAQDTDATGGVHVLPVEGGALGWLRTSDRFAPLPLARRGPQGNLLLVSGTPIRVGGGLDELLDRVVTEDLQGGTRLLAELDGAFAALLWDRAERRLAVVTDFQGMQPLYIAEAGGRFLLATEQKGICGSGIASAEPDPAGWGAFISFGHHIGHRTSIDGVRRADPGMVLVYDVATRGRSARPYWHWPAPASARTIDEVDTGSIFAALMRSVAAYREYGNEGIVLVSGGFDSRLVLALLTEAGLSPRALIVRHRDEHDDADGRLAVRAAQLFGVEYEVQTPPRDFYSSDQYRRYLQLSEGGNTSLGLFISQVSAYIRPEHRAIWEGIAPPLMKRLSRNPDGGGFDAYLSRACKNRTSLAWRAASYLFAPDWVDAMYEGFRQSLREEVERHADDEVGVMQFSIRNRTRLRLATNPFKVFGNDVLTLTPGLTRGFFDLVGGLSGRVKGPGDLTVRVLRERFPRALAAPFCSGGRLVVGDARPDVAFRIAKLRASLQRSWRVRRGLELIGLHRPFAFEIGGVQDALLAGVDVDDPRLNASVARSLVERRAEPGALADAARLHLFYWRVSALVATNPAAVRIAAPAQPPVSIDGIADVDSPPSPGAWAPRRSGGEGGWTQHADWQLDRID